VIGIDTNVLVRYLVVDNRQQFEKARRLLEEDLSAEKPGFVSSVVLAETVWVLHRTYKVGRKVIVEIVEGLLGADTLVLEHKDCAYFALAQYREGNLDFSDALIYEIADQSGCTTTVTFDRRASRRPGFTPL
jgi:predicted nucleic-acid-binding protein